MKKKKLGNIGEQVATEYLVKNNSKILLRNFYTRNGEIDIIAKYKNEIVFIEVKTRSSTNYGKPIEAVNRLKQKHFYNTAKFYLYKNKQLNRFVRFDVIEVLLKDGKFNINHIKQIM